MNRAMTVLVFATTAVLAACGGGNGDDGGDAGGTVKVTLQEFAVLPDVAEVAAGEVAFDATNTGPDDAHELVVIRTDLAVSDLPTKQDGSVDETGAGITVIGEIEEFAVGTTQSATFDLESGSYALICNVVEVEDGQTEAHYKLGMRAALTVT